MRSPQVLLTLLWAVIPACIFSLRSSAQCPNGAVSKSLSYGINLSGGGNDTHKFAFPQFDPSLGTLVKVDISNLITVKYNYQLENTDTVAINYKVRVNRTDEIVCSALQTPLSTSQFKVMSTHPLLPFDGITGSGPDYVSAGPIYPYASYPENYSITNNVAGFLGNGNVQFDYSSITDSYPSGSSHYLYKTNAIDSISVSLTYVYCVTSLLPAEISNFTANKMPGENVQLTWFTSNDHQGKKYETQVSFDAKTFVTFKVILPGTYPASVFQTTYIPNQKDQRKIFFRIKQVEAGVSEKYSAIKSVILPEPKKSAMIVYPTISTGLVNIYFPDAARENRQIQIISMSGEVMHQSLSIKTNLVKITLPQKMAKGMYFITAVNVKTQECQRSGFMINM